MEIKKTPIFQAKTKGFSLIEVMIVLAIIATVIGFGIPKLNRTFGSPIKTTTRNIVMLAKQLHSSAKLKNRTYRIVIEFPDLEKNKEARFFVESASSSQLLESEEEKKKKKSSFDKEESKFSPDPIMKKPVILPRGLKFASVETENYSRPITEGVAYIHFFPQGLIERSVIHLIDEQQREISLIINPLTGRTDVQPSNVSLKDLSP